MPATLDEATAIAEQLTPAEKVKLLKHLAQSLENTFPIGKKPKDLLGIWKGSSPKISMPKRRFEKFATNGRKSLTIYE